MEKTGIIEELKNRKKDIDKVHEEIENSETLNDKIGNGFKFAGKLLRFTTGIITAPVVLSLEIVSKTMPIVWETAVQVAHIPAALVSKIVKRDSPYNGQKINNVGNKIGKITEAIFEETANVVHKAF